MPAFVISELKTAFQIGFLLYIPFLVIDIVVATVLLAMGMMVLPPVVISLPFKLMPLVKELGRTRIQVDVKVRSCFSDKQFATNVKIRIPVPKYTSGATCKLTGGTAKYKSAEEALVWKIKKFQGMTELTLSAEVELVSTTTERKPWHKPPISMDFHVPMFTASGLRVRFLKVWEKSGYQSTKWVRYLCNSGRDTKTGVYEVRCQ